MAQVQGFFGSGSPGPCPICGAPNSTCGGPGPMPERIAFLDRVDLRPDPSRKPPRFVAPRDIVGRDGVGPHDVILYAQGMPIPLVVAIREGVAKLEDLTPEERRALAEHLKRSPQDLSDIRAMLVGVGPARKKTPRNVKDRMVRSQQVVRK